MYLITNQNNKTHRNLLWEINTTHQENDHFFHIYESQIVASFLFPFYEEDNIKPKLWECEPSIPHNCDDGKHYTDGVVWGFKKVTAKNTLPFYVPNIEKCITFSLLAAVNTNNQPEFLNWTKNYLLNNPQPVEKLNNVPMSPTSLCSILAIQQNSTFHAAAAGFRSLQDSNTNLLQIAEIAKNLTNEEIAEVIG